MFSEQIITWYQINKRDLPWRNTKDPYKIWLSEIMLQQTRVAQGLPYYQRFIEEFPLLENLAEASEQAVLKLWQGLGYYSRARNLHFTAKYVCNELDGVFPTNYEELLALKGIGDYTAAAMASFCFNEKRPVVDGNVFRVLARFFGIKTPINLLKAKKEFKDLANELMGSNNPGLFNQAIMEFGALHCTPANPDCGNCPLRAYCVAFQTGQVGSLPIKEKKLKISKRYFNYLVISTDENKTIVQKRNKKGIWQNLYEFPLVETEKSIDANILIRKSEFKEFIENQRFNLQLLTPKDVIHKLTHQHLHIKFWSLEVAKLNQNTMLWKSISSLPFPIVIHNFIEEYSGRRKKSK